MHDLRVWLRWLGQRDCKTVHRSYYEKVSTLTPFGTFLAQVYGYVPNNRTVMGGSLESLESQNVVGAAECNAVAWPGYMCVVMMCINFIMFVIITGMIGYAIIGLAKKKMLKMNAVCV